MEVNTAIGRMTRDLQGEIGVCLKNASTRENVKTNIVLGSGKTTNCKKGKDTPSYQRWIKLKSSVTIFILSGTK